MNPYASPPRTVTVDDQKVGDKIDVILSSVRPFGQDAAYDELQKLAINSWFIVAKNVVLFNMPEDTGNWQRPGIIYVNPDRNPPTIKQMLEYAKTRNEEDIVAIVNSDIVLSPAVAKIPRVAQANSLGRAWACTSLRQTLDPETMLVSGPADYGLDFFCSTVRIWNDVAKAVPGVLTIGRSIWDNWINTFLCQYIDRSKYFDITPWKCVIHPKHDGHFRLEHENQKAVDEAAQYMVGKVSRLPPRKLNLIT